MDLGDLSDCISTNVHCRRTDISPAAVGLLPACLPWHPASFRKQGAQSATVRGMQHRTEARI